MGDLGCDVRGSSTCHDHMLIVELRCKLPCSDVNCHAQM